MREKIDQLIELLQDREYEMTPALHKSLTALAESLVQETESLADLLQQMHDEYEILAEAKVVEYARFITGLPSAIVWNEYGMFKLALKIENQFQNELN